MIYVGLHVYPYHAEYFYVQHSSLNSYLINLHDSSYLQVHTSRVEN